MTEEGPVPGIGARQADPGPIPSLPSFPEFYHAVHGREPFPWQARLASDVLKQDRWPAEIGVPTGLGKTACLDIAVWWLSSQADRAPKRRTAPTRIWWVVNRRLLVDSTADHAERLAQMLDDPASAGLIDRTRRRAVERIAARLRSLWIEGAARPLDVIRLRGGIASRTPTDPARPTILLCTVPMYGSRLLFRGYGSKLRSVDAAMAGVDSLVLLDEAHLARHLRKLIPDLAACHPGAGDLLGRQRSRPMVVSLTATGDADESERFKLDADDDAHPVVRKRLDACKPLKVDLAIGNDRAKPLADAAIALTKEASAPAACIVFSNTPKTARETFERLRKALPEAEVMLLTGLTREREAAQIRNRILDDEHGMTTARPAGALRRRHLVVVATQTLEVGADIDAEYLVTEGCGVRALTQRLGRLNRIGRFSYARATYVHVPPSKSSGGRNRAAEANNWPVYGGEPEMVLERLLRSRIGCDDGTVDLSPRSVTSILGAANDAPGRAPEVLPGLLWEWTKTTTPPEGAAPVEPYFSGIAARRLSVSLLWRAHVPAPGKRLWPRARDREAVEVPLPEARENLENATMCRLESDGVTVEKVSVGDFRPGDRIVVASDVGHMDRFGWNPAAVSPVADDSLAGLGLPLDAVAIRRLCGAEVGRLIKTALGDADEDRDIDESERSEAVSDILAAIGDTPVPPGWEETEWNGFIHRLRPCVLEPRAEVARLLVEQPAGEDRSNEFDEFSLNRVAVELDKHCHAVMIRARNSAERIGLPDDLRDVVGLAAALHDIGKTDARFQRWLDPKGAPGPLLAKSDTPRHRWEATRVSAGWPKGGRHEELSARLVLAWLAQTPDWGSPLQRDLLVHLVVSHHGKGRPLVPPAADGATGSVASVVEGQSLTANANLALVDWEQPNRFQRLQEQVGPWGLALLEAIVIRADNAVSAGIVGTNEVS